MKKKVFGLSCCLFLFLFNSTLVSAEDTVVTSTSESNVVSTTSDSSTKIKNYDAPVDQSASTDLDSSNQDEDDVSLSLREWLLSLVPDYGLTKELVDSLSDEQLNYVHNVSLALGSQDISGTAKFLVKIYGPNPIPKDAYSVDYSKLTVEDMKQYIPQIRLSLIYGFDLDENLVNSISDQQFLGMIDNFYKDKADVWGDNGTSLLYYLSNTISNGNYNIITDDSSTNSTSTSSSTTTKKSSDVKLDTEKKSALPHTGEQQNRVFAIVGAGILTFLIVILFANSRKKHS